MQGNIGTGKRNHQVVFFFKNGFGASIIDDGYGGIGRSTNADPKNPLYEMALLRGTRKKWDISYRKKGIFADVEGWVDADRAVELLNFIRKLKK